MSALALAVPVAAIAPAAICEAKPVKHDPIYAAIDTYKRAYAFHGECCERGEPIEEAFHAKVRELEANLEENREWATAEMKKFYIRSKPDVTDDEAFTLLRIAGIRLIRAETGMDEAERLYSEGSNAETAARTAMLRTTPTTTAGMLALLTLILGEIEGPKATTMADIFGDDEAVLLLSSLASFARTQAGA
jgi:hypothetical protein